MVHSKVTGKLKEVVIADELKKNYVEYQTDFYEGDDVFAFENAGHALGTMVFKFDNMEEMFAKIARLTDDIVVTVY